MKNKVILDDIVVFRVLVIFFLIVYHSMAMFNGNWAFPAEYKGEGDIVTYRWIARIAYSVMLESFVFISGFLFALQISRYTFRRLIQRKFFRLMMPCIIWGIIYELLLHKTEWSVMTLVSGVGHLWFLPMLFWCFVIGYLFFNYVHNSLLVLSVALLLSVLSFFVPLPLGIGYTLKYFFYFALGYYCFLYRQHIDERMKLKYVLWMGALYLFVFVLYYFLKDNHLIARPLIRSLISFVLSVLYKCCGILGIYLLIHLWLKRRGEHLSSGVHTFSGYAFGIYIFHQMVLEFVYYHTDLPQYLNITLLPLMGMILALTISVGLTGILLRMPIGKILL